MRPARSLSAALLLLAAMIVLAAASYVGLVPEAEAQTESQQTDPQQDPAAEPVPQNPFPDRPPAPSLEGGVGWLNTSGEITLKDLRGKVVLLDFWTYCCINCMHVLPDLEYLEKKYNKELVVIGVHSAKFDNEQQTENIREAIVRYEIAHPVINDANMTVWRKFGIRAWPSVVLIDPEGNYCGYLSGEGNKVILDQIIGDVVKYHRAKGTLDETPVKFALEKEKQKPTPLKYPGKVLADPANKRLFISDSNHNRIVMASFDGKLLGVIGTGQIGLMDGDFRTAQFDHPQGMELVGDMLYIADTENHAIRAVDLKNEKVTTVAGTGEQARTRVSGGPIDILPLNSPWDVCHVDGTLYIAMAGPHQIWSHELGSKRIGVFSGTGREDIIDGPHDSSAFAQTSGMATDGKFLYVCDSEGSAIRKVPIDPEGDVSTIVGTHDLPSGRSLFEFGDVDGKGENARLQHPLGVAYRNGQLFVADTYNHKIKQIDLKTQRVETWLGSGKRGDSLKPPRFSEPSGLALAGNRLFIADTNNHRIVVADIPTRKVSEFTIEGLLPPAPPKISRQSPVAVADVVEIETQQVKTDGSLPVLVDVKLPDQFKLNPLAPVVYRIEAEGEQPLIAENVLGAREEATVTSKGRVKFSVPLKTNTGKATLLVTLNYNYCRDGKSGVCKIGSTTWKIPVVLGGEGKSELKLSVAEE
jgi:DNA-binding beta-propeller fold protein YncE/cytochrome oxidase Cu insertion factor (SCO1/SenC/PrrC family)